MNHQMTAVYGQQTETPKRDIFKVSKDWTNAPDGFEESELPRAIEIRKLIEQEKNPALKEDEKMLQSGELADAAAEPSQDQIDKEESKLQVENDLNNAEQDQKMDEEIDEQSKD